QPDRRAGLQCGRYFIRRHRHHASHAVEQQHVARRRTGRVRPVGKGGHGRRHQRRGQNSLPAGCKFHWIRSLITGRPCINHLIQRCSWNLILSWSAISLAVASARPSTLLRPLSSPYTFNPPLIMSPAGLAVATKAAAPKEAPGPLLPP